jgi:hypothetical protein
MKDFFVFISTLLPYLLLPLISALIFRRLKSKWKHLLTYLFTTIEFFSYFYLLQCILCRDSAEFNHSEGAGTYFFLIGNMIFGSFISVLAQYLYNRVLLKDTL